MNDACWHAPDRHVREPNEAADSCVMLLHGLGGCSEDFLSFPEWVDWPLHTRWLVPQAPEIMLSATSWPTPAWFDISSFEEDMVPHVGQLEQQCEWLLSQLEAQWQQGIDPRRTMVVGFSQGAVMALWLALSAPCAMAGAVSVSGFLPACDELAKRRQALTTDTPVLFMHGLEDRAVWPHWAEAAHAWVSGMQTAPVDWQTYEGEHQPPPDAWVRVARWMQRQLDPVHG